MLRGKLTWSNVRGVDVPAILIKYKETWSFLEIIYEALKVGAVIRTMSGGLKTKYTDTTASSYIHYIKRALKQP